MGLIKRIQINVLKRAKILFFLGLIMILTAAGIWYFQSRKTAEAATLTDWTETWTIDYFRTINYWSSDLHSPPNWTWGASMPIGPQMYTIYGCFRASDAANPCDKDHHYDYKIDYEASNWYGRTTTSGPAGEARFSDSLQSDVTKVGICPSWTTNSTGLYNGSITCNDVSGNPYLQVTGTSWPKQWVVKGHIE